VVAIRDGTANEMKFTSASAASLKLSETEFSAWKIIKACCAGEDEARKWLGYLWKLGDECSEIILPFSVFQGEQGDALVGAYIRVQRPSHKEACLVTSYDPETCKDEMETEDGTTLKVDLTCSKYEVVSFSSRDKQAKHHTCRPGHDLQSPESITKKRESGGFSR